MSEKELSKQIKRDCFTVKDSGLNFVLSLIVPFLASFALAILMLLFKLNNTAFEKIVNLIFTPTTFFLIYFIYCKKTNVNVFAASEIRFKVNWLKCLTLVVMGTTAVLLVSPFISLVDYLLTFVGYNPKNELPYVMNNGFKFVIGIISMAVLPAICEELLFRGLIFKGVQSKFGAHASIIITAAMFTLLHGSLQQTVYQFILGILLGYAMYYGRSIVYPILLHFVNNFIVVLSSFIYTLNDIDVNAPPIYASVWDYVLPVMLFILAGCLIVGLIYVLQYVDRMETTKEIKNAVAEVGEQVVSEILEEKPSKKSKKLESAEQTNSIIVNEDKKLTKEEKLYLFGSIGLSIFFWITNTIMQFFGL